MFLYDSSSKAKFHLKIVLAICILTKGFAINYTLIRTKFGPVIGHEYEVHPISIYVFKNIPYAKQPIGEMRFKPPEETDAWASENDLNQQPIYCPQSSSSYVKSLNYDVFGQEDCLFLDIYVRKEKNFIFITSTYLFSSRKIFLW
ncbi:venom carboxylesterase-6 [Caerostris extrusa]|uniref:Venom carboxylesterase-6 n=1 Tax=Caerostris extrusa TaxID=172846 RepID=A0AAV4UXU2_CAEEX|nr:venom carboxylesterase-6 [Caerostris extrusa]